MVSTQVGSLICPLREFHCCSDGREGGKGVSHMVPHLKALHLYSDERRSMLWEAIVREFGLFMVVEKSLKALKQWLCGRCMHIHALSRTCHHSDGLVCVTLESEEVTSHIICIPKPSIKEPDVLSAKDGLVLDARLLEEVLQAPIFTVKSIPHSCRLTFSQALKEALYKVVTEPSSVVNLWLGGRCPMSLSGFVASASLTPLLKPNGWIRPIAVGTTWRRLVAQRPFCTVCQQAVEPATWRWFFGYAHGRFSNAFNMVDRSELLQEVRVRCPSISLWVEFLYDQSARLYIGDDHIMSSTGVQQGDPLGPLLFALVLHPLILHAWHLDDGTVVGDSREVAKAFDIIRETGPRLGLVLNIRKTEIFWPSCDGSKLREGLFPSDIGRLVLGVKLLGGEQVAILFDKELRGAVEDIVVGEGPYFGDLQWRVASLPIRVGGLGLYSAVEAASYAFVASKAQTWVLQDHILRDSGIYGMDSDFNIVLDGLRDMLPTFDISNFASKDTVPQKSQHVLASGLFIIPIDGLGQHMSPIEYRTILRYRIMIPIFPIDEVCPVCRKACLDQFGEHAVHCKELPGFKYRHDFVRDVLCDIFKRVGVSVKKEAHVNFLTDPQEGRLTLRPIDVLVYGWIGGKHACLDLTGVSSLVRLRTRDVIVGHAQSCFKQNAVDLLKRVQRVMHNNVVSPRSMNVVFKRICFAIQKGLTTQLVVRLPFINTIPSKFARRYMQDYEGIAMIRRFGEKRIWKVNVKCDLDLGYTWVNTGWKQFCEEYNLQIGDVCKFEMTQSDPLSFTVTINRVGE
ncbi:auxilin-like protein [Trifolium pratense]|uniref:Auxilin-like protein n=1 Tax=Trifolium pratense TaxID=57577 RepID=A0A2K3PJ03_TRIPR|nr:auxilin-like protein [Trifolium pratense]